MRYRRIRTTALLIALTSTGTGVHANMACIDPPDGLVSWWPGNEAATDAVGVNDASIGGDAALAIGLVNLAFGFDGDGDFLEVADDPTLDVTGGLSVAAWVFPASDQGAVVTKIDNAPLDNSGWGLAVLPDERSIFFVAVDGVSASATSAPGSVPLNTWSFLVGTSDGDTVRLYVNGELVDSIASESLPTNDETLLVGAFQRDGIEEQFFNGVIDEVAFYNLVLTGQEIMAEFCAGIGGKCQDVFRDGFESGTTRNWTQSVGR